jgi:hypothetical protein
VAFQAHMNTLRRLLGGAFGTVVLIVGMLSLVVGLASLALGLYVLVVGEFHGRWSAIFYLPVGALFSFLGYGATRLGWDTIRKTTHDARTIT